MSGGMYQVMLLIKSDAVWEVNGVDGTRIVDEADGPKWRKLYCLGGAFQLDSTFESTKDSK